VTRADELTQYAPYGSAVPVPTPLRNHQMFLDIREGLGPMYMRTDEAMQRLSGETRLKWTRYGRRPGKTSLT